MSKKKEEVVGWDNFNKLLNYDQCKIDQDEKFNRDAFYYQIEPSKRENCKRCVSNNKMYFKGDVELVDRESDLRGITRPSSGCDRFGYSKDCKKSKICTSTFDPSNPIIPDPSICYYNRQPFQRLVTPVLNYRDFDPCKFVANK